jgi:CRISPR-associated RAMP protein (TIGR02581 family)
MFDTFQNRLTVDGYIVAESALRVGAGRASALTGTELAVLRDSQARPFIPGSSLKGVLRSHLEAVARGMAPAYADLQKIACDPTDKDHLCLTDRQMQALKRDARYQNDEAQFADAIHRELCLTCQTFGSPWWASPVRVRDLPVITDEWFGQFEVRDGVAIDRDKGTAADGKLYNYEVVPAGTRFVLHIEAENLEPWQRGLLWLGVRALKRGKIALGGFTSRGLGWIRLEAPKIRYLEGTAAFLGLLHGAEMGEAIDQETAKDWAAAFREKLNTKGAHHA